ncbi:MAG TPA: hypothetical protein VFK07_00745 [Candidatus Paceibacterota bacterium]|nr:hypothetical protein [Candidatus Paceibacterota bacterium]
MRTSFIKISLTTAALAAVVYPLWVHIQNSDWSGTSLAVSLFPLFGLIAFAILWLHIVSGVFEPWLRRQFDFDFFIRWTSILVLICIIVHPLLLLFALGFDLNALFGFGELPVWLGIIGFLLLLTYDLGKLLRRKNDFFVRHWRHILAISTLGFIFIFFHSLLLGTDIQAGALRDLWWFYGITGIGAALWLYRPGRRTQYIDYS